MVVGVSVGRSPLNVVVVFLADIEFATDNWLYAGLVGRVHEMHGTKNIAVVGHGNRGHAQLFHPVDKFFHVAGAVEHRIIGMEMQVNELGHERSIYFNGKFKGGMASLSTARARGRVARDHTESPYCLGSWKSRPRSSFALLVASMSSHESGSFVARCSLKIQSVPPTMA